MFVSTKHSTPTLHNHIAYHLQGRITPYHIRWNNIQQTKSSLKNNKTITVETFVILMKTAWLRVSRRSNRNTSLQTSASCSSSSFNRMTTPSLGWSDVESGDLRLAIRCKRNSSYDRLRPVCGFVISQCYPHLYKTDRWLDKTSAFSGTFTQLLRTQALLFDYIPANPFSSFKKCNRNCIEFDRLVLVPKV